MTLDTLRGKEVPGLLEAGRDAVTMRKKLPGPKPILRG